MTVVKNKLRFGATDRATRRFARDLPGWRHVTALACIDNPIVAGVAVGSRVSVSIFSEPLKGFLYSACATSFHRGKGSPLAPLS